MGFHLSLMNYKDHVNQGTHYVLFRQKFFWLIYVTTKFLNVQVCSNDNTVYGDEVCRCLGTAWSLQRLFGLLDPEVEGNTVLRKVASICQSTRQPF